MFVGRFRFAQSQKMCLFIITYDPAGKRSTTVRRRHRPNRQSLRSASAGAIITFIYCKLMMDVCFPVLLLLEYKSWLMFSNQIVTLERRGVQAKVIVFIILLLFDELISRMMVRAQSFLMLGQQRRPVRAANSNKRKLTGNRNENDEINNAFALRMYAVRGKRKTF